MNAPITVRTRSTASTRTTAPTRRVAAARYGLATRYSMSETAVTRATTTTTTPATAATRLGSGDANGCVLRFALERLPDLLEAGAREIALRRIERVQAEPRELEQSREPIHRAWRKRQAVEDRAHELVGGLPGRAGHPRARRHALEAPV